MTLGRVIGNLVSTQKNEKLEGTKLMLVQPLDLEIKPRGVPILAIDGVEAGVGDLILLIQDGRSAQLVLGKGTAAVDAAIIGVVDAVEMS